MNKITLYLLMLLVALGGLCTSCSSDDDETFEIENDESIGYWYDEADDLALEIMSEKDYRISKGEKTDPLSHLALVYRLWSTSKNNHKVIFDWTSIISNCVLMPFDGLIEKYSLSINDGLLILNNTDNPALCLYFERIDKNTFKRITGDSGGETPSTSFPPSLNEVRKSVECSARYSNYCFEFTVRHKMKSQYPGRNISYSFAQGNYYDKDEDIYVMRWTSESLIEKQGSISISSDNEYETAIISVPFFYYYSWRALTEDYFYDKEQWEKKFYDMGKYWTSYQALKKKSDWSDIDKSLFNSVCEHFTAAQKDVSYDYGVWPVIIIEGNSYCLKEYRLKDLINK